MKTKLIVLVACSLVLFGCIADTTSHKVTPNDLYISSYRWVNPAEDQPGVTIENYVDLHLIVKSNVEKFVRISVKSVNSYTLGLMDENKQLIIVQNSPIIVRDEETFPYFRNYTEKDIRLIVPLNVAKNMDSIKICFETEWQDSNIACTTKILTPLNS